MTDKTGCELYLEQQARRTIDLATFQSSSEAGILLPGPETRSNQVTEVAVSAVVFDRTHKYVLMERDFGPIGSGQTMYELPTTRIPESEVPHDWSPADWALHNVTRYYDIKIQLFDLKRGDLEGNLCSYLGLMKVPDLNKRLMPSSGAVGETIESRLQDVEHSNHRYYFAMEGTWGGVTVRREQADGTDIFIVPRIDAECDGMAVWVRLEHAGRFLKGPWTSFGEKKAIEEFKKLLELEES